MTLPVVFTANGPSGYNLTNSLRFRSSASAYLNRTPASAGNRKTWTWSGWVKRGTLSTSQRLFNAYSGDENNTTEVGFDTTNNIIFSSVISGSQGNGFYGQTSAVFRDPSAWYHIVFSVDTTQSTATAALKVYVNGVQQTLGSSSYGGGTNQNTWINDALPHRIGQTAPPNSAYFDGYLAEVNFIDGQALTPSSFGETSTTTGVWIPKKYTGSYGTNGFYLPFTDNSALTTSSNVGLGKDFSGNANYWTTNNISITSGSTYDSMTDVPTLTSTTAANYAVMNPLIQTSNLNLSNGNLTITGTGSYSTSPATFGMSSGKWYWEYTCTTYSASGDTHYGIGTSAFNIYQNTWAGSTSAGWIYAASNGNKYNNNSATAYGSSFTSGDVIGVAFDADNGTLTFYKNNTSQGTAFTGLTSGAYFPVATVGTSNVTNANFGQRPFAYTPPTGFVALNTFNLPTPTIGATASTTANKYFDATLFTGTGANATITNSGSMQPDFIWGKSRSNAFNHILMDSVRGTGVTLFSNSTSADYAVTDAVTAFNSNGFNYGVDPTCNTNGSTNVFWQWRASNATAVTNTAGSITSTVSANTTSGFSVVTWVHSSTTSTIGHGLGVAPQFIILKSRTTAYNWDVGCNSIGWGNRLNLNTTDAAYSPAFWNSTAPTSTVFTYAGSGATNGDNMVAYCFTPIAGYSAFGSYTGNGSTDGTFVYTGFRPRFVLWKNITQASQWILLDTARNTYNVANAYLEPNTSDAENTASTVFDMLSNGFKLRNSGGTDFNENANTYIYMAFAESPFKYANAR